MKITVRALVVAVGVSLAVMYATGVAAQGGPTAPPNTKGVDYQRIAKLKTSAEHAHDRVTFETARNTLGALASDAQDRVVKQIGEVNAHGGYGTPAHTQLVAQYKAWSDYRKRVFAWRFHPKRQSKVRTAKGTKDKAIKLPTRSLSFEQQQVASAWYRQLGKIKRKGLDAMRRGDRHALDSAIQRAAIVITDAKKGEGALGTLPIVIRNQIAKEGRQVIKALSARSRNATRGRPREASRNRSRSGRRGAPRSKSSAGSSQSSGARNCNAGGSTNGGSATAQGQGYDIKDEITHFLGHPIFFDLFSPPPAETEEEQLRKAAADYSRAQAAWSQGPSASGRAQDIFETHRGSLEYLAKNARSPRVRKRARIYLSRLPKHFVSGQSGKKKVSKKKGVERRPAPAHRSAGSRIQKNSYPSEDSSVAGGGD